MDVSNEVAPDPAGIRTVDQVVGYLRQLRAWAGHVSYPELVRRINKRRAPSEQARQTTVYDCFKPGRKRLDVELVLDIAAALGLDGPRRHRLRRALATAREAAEGAPDSRVPRQLPAAPQMFTGRTRELAVFDCPHDTSTVVIAAVDGMAGVGKTALAVHAAHRIAGRYPDGQLFIDLHGYTQGLEPVAPGEALGHALRALGVPGQQIPASLDERAALYRTRLADRRMLIVLDNAATEVQVQPLLPGSPGCLALVTSRRRLAGLDQTHSLSLDVLSLADAVVLFVRTAGEGRLATEPPALVAETVELCGRLPLAIRIAAARLRSHPAWNLGLLLERLRDQRQRLVELAAGQRSVTAAVDLSYLHLSGDQQRTYRLLGLHPGPDIDPYAAAALLDSGVVRARHLLDHLLDAHLLLEPGAGRYRFHDLTRAHAAHTATRDGTDPAGRSALSRLFDYYRHAASVAMDAAYPYERERRPRVPPAHTPTPDLSDPTRALGWLDAELPNLLAAARYAAESGWPAHSVELSAILRRHLRTRGHCQDAELLHHQALVTARTTGHRAGELDALFGLGWVRWRLGRHAQAIDHFEQALQVARATGHRAGELDALNGLGHVHRMQGRHAQAGDHHREALRIARGAGHRAGEMEALNGLGHVHRMQGRDAQAIDHFEQALQIARGAGHRTSELNALNGLGDVCRRQGRLDQATDHYRQLLDLARRVGSRNMQFEALQGLGRLHHAAGHPDAAITHHDQALALAGELGQPDDEARAHDGLARVHHTLHQRELAHRHWNDALHLLTALGVDHTDDADVNVATIRAHLAELGRQQRPGAAG